MVESAFNLAFHEPTIFPKHLPANLRVEVARNLFNADTKNIKESQNSDSAAHSVSNNLKELLEETERQYLKSLLSSKKNKQEICLVSGLSRSRLYERLKKYNLI